jgi:porphobilinogen synthase
MKRLMRLRQSPHLREMCAETEFTTSHLIQPLFAVEELGGETPIPGLKGNARLGLDACLRRVESDLEAGVRHFLLFPVPRQKKSADFDHRFAGQMIAAIHRRFGENLFLWVDVCLCSSTDHGHCAVLDERGRIDLESTHQELARAALRFVEAGAGGVSPSDMMDGRVARLRQTLDQAGFDAVPIMSYSTKFASNFYGPFREAADSAPRFGDRKTYQIDVRNRSDALASSQRCAEEGADLLMVKPGLTSLDLIRPIRNLTSKPVGAYQVSGEYAGLALLEERGLIQFGPALLETWHVLRRAGSQFVISYGARYARSLGVKVAG